MTDADLALLCVRLVRNWVVPLMLTAVAAHRAHSRARV